MMQKRTLYISLLLVSCLLFFGYSYASAQTVSFQNKNASRCSDVIVNITVENPGELSAFEIVFEVNGDYSSMSVDWAGGFAGLTNRVDPIVDGNVVRMAAMKADAEDGCVDFTGGVVVGEISFHTAEVCTGSIDVIGATVTGGCCDAVNASTGLVGCDPVEAIATTVVPGSVTIVNNAPSVTCPGDTTIHWGDLLEATVDFSDADLTAGCETLSFEVTDGPGSIDDDGNYSWQTGGDDVCGDSVTITVTDECDATAECSFYICVENTPPEITADPADTLFAVWCITLSDQVVASDPDGGPNSLLYSLVSFDGPTWFGAGLQLDANTGEWSWTIGDDPEYLGDFTLCVKVSDGANLCDPCSPENADTACYNIHVAGFAISIEKVHKQLQGHIAEVSIYLDSTFMPDEFCCDLIGGFDFLVAYDASALTALPALPGALIDDDKFEYFTYRYGPFGNCGNGCPSGMMRIVAIREYNDGVFNDYHVTGPGELVKLNFLVSTDYNLECQYVPVRFFWYDCGDNTLSDESGNWLHLGLQVYDFGGGLITDPVEYGFTGPEAACFDTVYSSEQAFKNAPIGSIIFRNGGVDIICKNEIDDRGDVNLNGIVNEIADAVVFTNYFIEGLGAFTINVEGQMAATEINGDGIALTVADLVYLIRIIVGDAMPLPKANPNAYADFKMVGSKLQVETNVELGAALFVFNGHITPTLAADAAGMELKYGYSENTTRILVWSQSATAISSGSILNVSGGRLVSIETADIDGNTVAKVEYKLIPIEYSLSQNYPNPFNPATNVALALPVASDWNVSIYNVSGQKVAEFSGYSEAGMVNITWDATNVASGMYFYQAKAGSFTETKKMLLLK